MNYTYLDFLASFGVGGAHPGGLQLSKYIVEREKINNATSILDVGCGTGQTSAYLSKQFHCSVTALDCNKVMVAKAKERFSALQLPINLIEGSADSLPFDDHSFDIILAESVTAFTRISSTISEFSRVLKPDGILLAVEMTLEKPAPEDDQNVIKDFYGVTQLCSETDWYNHFKEANFRTIEIEKYEVSFDNLDLENATEFSLSENVDDELIDVLETHEYYTDYYKDILGFRIFRCCR